MLSARRAESESAMSYDEYLSKTGDPDKRATWIAWKVEICGMSPIEATKAAYDPEWGWTKMGVQNNA